MMGVCHLGASSAPESPPFLLKSDRTFQATTEDETNSMLKQADRMLPVRILLTAATISIANQKTAKRMSQARSQV